MENREAEKEKILKSLENLSGNYWKTISEIAKLSSVAEFNVIQIVMASGEFVQSFHKDKEGEPVFTTKNAFYRQETILDQIFGEFQKKRKEAGVLMEDEKDKPEEREEYAQKNREMA